MLSRTARCIHHQALTRTNAVSRTVVSRSMHVTCRIQTAGLRSNSILKLSKYTPVLGACAKSYASTVDAATNTTGDATIDNIIGLQTTTAASTPIAEVTTTIADANIGESLTAKVLDPIPDVPVPPTVLDTVSFVGEPPLEALGLGGWWPPGMVQQALEFLHVGCDLPWWGAIAVGTVVIRTMLFPVVVLAQRNAAVLYNQMPQMTRLQTLMTEARKEGDQIKAARYSQEMMLFMKEKKCNPLKNMIVPLFQAPIFISCFLGLRKMAEYPIESMKEGGLWWFTDLTVPDPYYILPIITAATLAATIELGTDNARAQTMGMMRYVLRAVPIVIFPFTIHFPGAILCYWCCTNFISLAQVGILKIPKVRKFFKIEQMVKHPPKAIAPKEGFVQGFKSSWSNMKASREANARYEVDEVQFLRAGRGPLRKTYAYDPTKQFSAQQKPATVMAKKR